MPAGKATVANAPYPRTAASGRQEDVYKRQVLLGVASNAQNLDNSVLMVTQLLYSGKV